MLKKLIILIATPAVAAALIYSGRDTAIALAAIWRNYPGLIEMNRQTGEFRLDGRPEQPPASKQVEGVSDRPQ